MVIGIGTDITDVGRIAEAIAKYGESFLRKIFTETEQAYCESFRGTSAPHYTARFAAKEAFSKAIGTGMRDGFRMRDVGVRNEPSGKPTIELHGLMQERWGKHRISLSLSHTSTLALAMVVIESPLPE